MLAEPGKPPRRVLSVVSSVHYVDPGYLVFAREGTLLGQRFDLASGSVRGEPFSIADPVRYFPDAAWAAFAVSRNGVLAYSSLGDRGRIAWIDRSGQELESLGVSAKNNRLRISPDGRQVLFDRAGTGTLDLWTLDLGRGTETRLTSDPAAEMAGAWDPGQSAVIFTASRGGPPHLFRKDLATGAELVDRLLQGPGRLEAELALLPEGQADPDQRSRLRKPSAPRRDRVGEPSLEVSPGGSPPVGHDGARSPDGVQDRSFLRDEGFHCQGFLR